MINSRDIETLSAYLDGQLNASDAARLEARLKTDPELASVISDLRAARSILRKLPARKAPRNFTLTRQMVGLKPPLPRSYSIFRFATAFAAVLFFFSFTATTLLPILSFGGAAAPMNTGYGGGCDGCGGGAPETAMEAASVEELPAATEAATEAAPAQDMAPAAEIAPVSTATPAAEDRVAVSTVAPKQAPTGPPAVEPIPVTVMAPTDPEAPFNWTVLFLLISIASGLAMWIMRQNAKSKWR